MSRMIYLHHLNGKLKDANENFISCLQERTPDKGFMLPSPQSFSARTDATTAIASPL